MVKCPTSAQVKILWFTSSSASGSVLTAPSLEPASDSVSPSLSDPPPIHALSLSVSKINKKGAPESLYFKSLKSPSPEKTLLEPLYSPGFCDKPLSLFFVSLTPSPFPHGLSLCLTH